MAATLDSIITDVDAELAVEDGRESVGRGGGRKKDRGKGMGRKPPDGMRRDGWGEIVMEIEMEMKRSTKRSMEGSVEESAKPGLAEQPEARRRQKLSIAAPVFGD